LALTRSLTPIIPASTFSAALTLSQPDQRLPSFARDRLVA